MKKLQFFLPVMFLTTTASAQKMIQKWSVSVPALHCEDCEAIIENKFNKRVDGITGVDANWKRKIVKFEYAPERIDTANIKLMLSDLGFDAGDELAEEDAMKKLPECCRRGYEDPKKKAKSGGTTAAATSPATPATPAAPPTTPATTTTDTKPSTGAKPATPAKPASPAAAAKPVTSPAKPATPAQPATPATKPKPAKSSGKSGKN